jgi:hypothetical protein
LSVGEGEVRGTICALYMVSWGTAGIGGGTGRIVVVDLKTCEQQRAERAAKTKTKHKFKFMVSYVIYGLVS